MVLCGTVETRWGFLEEVGTYGEQLFQRVHSNSNPKTEVGAMNGVLLWEA